MQKSENKCNRPFFVILNSKGSPQCKVPFLNAEERVCYEAWVEMERQRLLMLRIKEEEESTNELEFEPFVPVFTNGTDQ